MATLLTDNSIAGDLLIFDQIFDYAYPKSSKENKKFARNMVKQGCLSVETLLELAISNCGKLNRKPTTGMDFCDGSDAKKATSYINTNVLVASISNIDNKNGFLRCVVAVPLFKRVAFFKIPPKFYKTYKGELRMTFSLIDGTCKSKKIIPYQVDTFEEICF